MVYTREQIIKMCDDAMKTASTFYQQPFVNYRGRTTDTGELYNEVVAEYVCKHLKEFVGGIKKITRETTYKTASHTVKHIPSALRQEEKIAVEIFNQKYFDYIGEVIDYQTPLKNKEDEDNEGVGKIDLLSYDDQKLYILELKKPDSDETMLRCVLEGFTYLKTLDAEKLLVDFELPLSTRVVSCPFVFLDKKQNHEMNEDRPWLKKVMNLLNSKPYFIKEENGKYFVIDNAMKLKRNEITDIDLWFALRPPMGGKKQWKNGRSAKELARYMTVNYPDVPREIEDLLLRFTSAGSEFEWDAEYVTDFEKYGLGKGEGRNHDGMMVNGDIFVGIEGKADESLGNLLGEELEKVGSNKMDRINGMIKMLFDDEAVDHKELRYQLITASTATMLEAKERNLSKALLLVLVFKKEGSYSPAKIERNNNDISIFLTETNAEQKEGYWKIPNKTGIDLYFKKIEIELY